MKIAVISDWHLGVDWGSELEKDSFSNLRQAFIQIQDKNIDLILVPGDLFDQNTPNQEILYDAINLLADINVENKIDLKNHSNRKLKLPMISIIGNHEYKGKDQKSTVHLLEAIGFTTFLHKSNITITKDSEKINVFGLSGIPDKYALDVLKDWDPKPVPNEYNILMIHQSIKEYLPFEDDMISTISLSHLPKDFNLIINGHLHWSSVEKLDSEAIFILPGSTVTTQLKKLETEKEKGFFIIDTVNNAVDFEKIDGVRKTYYIDLKFNKEKSEEVLKKIKEEINKKLLETKPEDKKPLIRVRIKGDLDIGQYNKDLNISNLKKEFENKTILSITNNLEEKSLKESIDKLKEIQSKENVNINDTSVEIFFEQIEQLPISKDFDYKRIYDLLKNNNIEKVKEILLQE